MLDIFQRYDSRAVPTVLAVGAGRFVKIFFFCLSSLFFLPLSGRRLDID